MKHGSILIGALTLVTLFLQVPRHCYSQGGPQAKKQVPVQQQAAMGRRSEPHTPDPVPFRSKDGKITGWKVAVPGGRPLATPAVADGKVFVGGGFGSHEFYAFDAATGKRLWTYQTADDGPTAAVVEDGLIAFNTESCELEIITTNGKPVWKKWLGDPLMSMPAIEGGSVYMAYPDSRGDRKHYVAAFDLKTGKELWKQPIPGEIITAPIVNEQRVYLATLEGALFSFDRSGKLLWQEKKNATSAPAVWNQHCYFSRREETSLNRAGKTVKQQNEVVAARGTAPASLTRAIQPTFRVADYLDYAKRAGSLREQASEALDVAVGFGGANKGDAKIMQSRVNLGLATVHGVWAYQGSKPFIDNGRLFSSMGDVLQSVDPKTEKVLWKRTLHENKKESELLDSVLTPPAIVNGKVFVGTAFGEIIAVSAQSGELQWKAEIGEPVVFQPVVSKGRVYVSTANGSLYCLNTGDGRDDGWLMWGANATHNGLH